MYYTTLTPLSTIKTSKKNRPFAISVKNMGIKRPVGSSGWCASAPWCYYTTTTTWCCPALDNISHHVSSRWLLFCCYPSVLLGIDVYFLMQQTANQAGFVGQPRIPFSGIIVLLYRPSALLPLDEKRDPFYDDLLYQKLSAWCPLFRSHKFIITINNKILQNR